MISQTDLIIFGVVAVVMLLMAPSLLLVFRTVQRSDRMLSRLERSKSGKRRDKPGGKGNRSMGEVLGELGKRATPGNAEQISAIRFKLMRGGFLSQKAVSIYYGGRFLALVLPQILIVPFLGMLADMHEQGPIGASLLVLVIGLMGPDKFIEGRTKNLEREYREGFPDMMDLMVACIEAGMSIDAAVTRVSEELVGRYPNLAMHLNIIALELRAGRGRNDAWKNFAQRLGIDEADSLSTMLRQAEEMGSSVGHTLRVFSKDMRQKRMLRAEEQALALSAKMSLPLILFVFPTLLGVLMLPVVVTAMENLV